MAPHVLGQEGTMGNSDHIQWKLKHDSAQVLGSVRRANRAVARSFGGGF